MAGWSDEEIKIIKSDLTIKEMLERLSGRTEQAVRKKRNILGIISKKQKIWTDEEISVLKSDMSIDEMCIFLPDRKRKSIIVKKRNIGNGVKVAKPWTEREEKIVKMNIPLKEIKELLPDRTLRSIQGKRTHMKVNPVTNKARKWTQEELEILTDGYPLDTKAELQEKLGRSWSSIVAKAFVLNVERKVHFQE